MHVHRRRRGLRPALPAGALAAQPGLCQPQAGQGGRPVLRGVGVRRRRQAARHPGEDLWQRRTDGGAGERADRQERAHRHRQGGAEVSAR